MFESEQFVKRCQAGDLEAFANLFRHYQQRLYGLACTIMRDEETAADVVQDTFLTVFQKIGSYKGDSAFETWLIAIAVNQCRSRLRKQKVRRFLSLESLRHGLLSQEPTVEFQVGRQIQNRSLWQNVDQLDERLRMPLILRYQYDIPAREVAKILNLPVNRLYQQLHEGRKRLRILLNREDHPTKTSAITEVESC